MDEIIHHIGCPRDRTWPSGLWRRSFVVKIRWIQQKIIRKCLNKEGYQFCMQGGMYKGILGNMDRYRDKKTTKVQDQCVYNHQKEHSRLTSD
jgi:hypothetical protein